MFCPLCRNAMSYDKLQDSYRCGNTDFHHDRNIAIVAGVTRFKGSVLRQDDDIEKSHVLLILKKNEGGMREIIKGSDITVHEK